MLPSEAEHALAQHEHVRSALSALAGQTFNSDAALVSFGAGAQIGDVTIGDIAGQNLVKLTITLAPDPFDVHDLPSPYQGLSAFAYDDRAKYGGRRQLITAVTRRLVTAGAPRSLLFVTGDSGCGKSSFVQAGLVPALEAHYQEIGRQVRRALIRPGPYPLAALAAAITQLGLPAAGVFSPLSALMEAGWEPEPIGSTVSILVCDQFEELFTQSDPAQRDATLRIVGGLPPFSSVPLHLIVTLRSDYLPDLFAQAQLYDEVKRGVELRAMNVEELIEAIKLPLVQTYPHAGRRFEPALLERLATEAAQSATYLPLLQVTLEDLWRQGHLTSGAFHTLTDAISRRAEEVYLYRDYNEARSHERTPYEREQLLDILLCLVEVSLDDDVRRDVRRPRPTHTVTLGDPLRAQLVDDLCQARLLSKGALAQPETPEPPVDTVDIIHESLIRNWGRFQAAIRERRSILQERARFEQALREWLAHDRHHDYLLRGVRLAEAEELSLQSDVALQAEAAQDLVLASCSQREQDRQHELEQVRLLAEARQHELEAETARRQAQELFSRRMQRRALLLAAALVLALAAAGAAAFFASAAQRSAQESALRLQSVRAEQARLSIDTQPELAIALAIAAASTPVADDRLGIDRALYSTFDRIALTHAWQAHRGNISDALWSADGRRLVTIGDDQVIRWWNAQTGLLDRRWTLEHMPNAIARDPAGRQLLVSFLGEGFVLYRDDAVVPIPPSLTSEGARDLIWSPTDDRVIVVPQIYTDSFRIWDLRRGREVALAKQGCGVICIAAWSPDASIVLVGDGKGVHAYNAADGRSIGPVAAIGPVERIAWATEGKRLLTGGTDGTITLWQMAVDSSGVRAKEVLRLTAHTSAISALSWSRDGQRALIGSVDGAVAVWNLSDGRPVELHRFQGSSWIVAARWDNGNNRWLTADKTGMVRLWDMRQDARIGSLESPDESNRAITALDWSSASGRIAGGDTLGMLHIWDDRTNKHLTTLPTPPNSGPVLQLAWSPDGRRLAASYKGDNGQGCALVLWDAEQSQQLWYAPLSYRITSIAWSEDGRELLTANGKSAPGWCAASCDNQAALRVWDSANHTITWKQPSPSETLFAARWWSGGQRIAAVSKDPCVGVWDRERDKWVWKRSLPYKNWVIPTELPIDFGGVSLALNADRQRLLIGSPDPAGYVFDVMTGADLLHKPEALEPQPNRTVAPDEPACQDSNQNPPEALEPQPSLVGHTQAITAVAWMVEPDGWMITGSVDGTLRIWDATGEQVVAYRVGGPILSLALSPDGAEVISSTGASIERRLIDRERIRAVLERRLCSIHLRDDARIRSLIPGWDWPGCPIHNPVAKPQRAAELR